MATGETFPVFDPVTEEFLYYKQRELVHIEGDWHRGVQANIVRPNEQGTFDILLQERSGIVDIGTNKYDQSLATQMLDIDGLDQANTLRRGLLSELNVEDYEAVQLPSRLRIAKTYEDHPGTLNRELISLYLVRVDGDAQIKAVTPKVERLSWMEWHEFLNFFVQDSSRFTKTGQFYFSDPEILPAIESASYALIRSEPIQQETLAPESAIVHVDRWPEPPATFRGNLGRILEESGEVVYE